MTRDRVLVSFVGNTDPDKDPACPLDEADGPILSIIRHFATGSRKPIKRAVLFHTPENRDRFEALGSFCKNLDNPIEVEECEVDVNPSLEADVLRDVLLWLDMSPEVIRDSDVLFNIASGTPAIRSVWTYVHESGLTKHSELWYSQDPTKPFTYPRVRREGIRPIDEVRRVRIAASLTRGMSFSDAADMLRSVEKLSVTTTRIVNARLFADVLEAMSDWDKAYYRTALDKFDKVLKDEVFPRLPEKIQVLLRQYQQFLFTLTKSEVPWARSYCHAFDMFMSLSRRHASGQYANVATRYRRLVQASIQYPIHFASEPVKCTDGVFALKKAVLAQLPITVSHGDLIALEIDFIEYQFTPRMLNDNYFQFYKQEEAVNQSVELHGDDEVSEEKSKNLLSKAKKILCRTTSGSTYNSSIPESANSFFGASTVRSIAGIMEHWI